MRPGGPLPGTRFIGHFKYKGKTNEAFTRLLINYALCAGDFAGNFDQPLRLLDPMCGRGTALFEGLNRGYHAYGADVDRNGLEEGRRFLKRYLEYTAEAQESGPGPDPARREERSAARS